MNKAFFVIARTDSNRLPAKAFLELANTTVLGCILEQLQQHKNIPIVVLSSDRAVDNELMQTNYPSKVFGNEMTHEYFLIHLIGHLSYHLGQINYLRRIIDAK